MSDEDPPLIVCYPDRLGNPGGFDDNVHGQCARCFEPIHWRPHVPAHFVRICAFCFNKNEGMDPDLEVTMLNAAVDELLDFLRTTDPPSKTGGGH